MVLCDYKILNDLNANDFSLNKNKFVWFVKQDSCYRSYWNLREEMLQLNELSS